MFNPFPAPILYVRVNVTKTLFKPPLFFFCFFLVNILLLIDICKPQLNCPPPTFLIFVTVSILRVCKIERFEDTTPKISVYDQHF